MPTKALSSAKLKPSAKPGKDGSYEVVLREGGGRKLVAEVEDRVLYPMALAWNRLLSSDRGRQSDEDKEARAWRASGRETILKLADAGEVSRRAASAFITAAAKSGVVQVEMAWQREDAGWAARVFPWEALLALATKEERKRIGQREFLVLRVLTGGVQRPVPKGMPGFAVSESAEAAGFDFKTERAAIHEALQGNLQTLGAKSLEELARDVKRKQPRIVHLVLNSAEKGAVISKKDRERSGEVLTRQVAEAVAAHGPEIVFFSSCYTGRRLAPLAVACGAKVAVGFHGEVLDASIPVFVGAFYRAWQQGSGVLGALRAGLAANGSQADPAGLGVTTLWSAADAIGEDRKVRAQPAKGAGEAKAADEAASIPPEELAAALSVTCEIEESLNYSVLHNSRGGGFFKAFTITKIKAGKLPALEVTVKLDPGLDRPAECHFFASLPVEADRQQDLAAGVTFPLGSQLLRQRGETLLATMEITVRCGDTPVFHTLRSIKLLPCDEWRDDDTGRRFLPSFVFPRDPAVREILTTAQPFLRALCDQPQAGFDGYQSGFAASSAKAADLQARAIWAALQHTTRLDYVNPPPAYTVASQRLRPPEEILRARRGTCIELALLLASCWEHVGIFPVIFLTSGHAFPGYWTSESARTGFIKKPMEKLFKHARIPGEAPDAKKLGGTTALKKPDPWMFAEPYHLAAILLEVDRKNLVPLEATFIPLQRSFADAVEESKRLLLELRGTAEFDVMIDVQKAREKGITPLAVITQGIVA